MRPLVVLFVVALFAQQPAPVTCTIGTGGTAWKGSPLELAGIEAVWQREQAERDRRPYPTGAPEPSPWSVFVRCRPV